MFAAPQLESLKEPSANIDFPPIIYLDNPIPLAPLYELFSPLNAHTRAERRARRNRLEVEFFIVLERCERAAAFTNGKPFDADVLLKATFPQSI